MANNNPVNLSAATLGILNKTSHEIDDYILGFSSSIKKSAEAIHSLAENKNYELTMNHNILHLKEMAEGLHIAYQIKFCSDILTGNAPDATIKDFSGHAIQFLLKARDEQGFDALKPRGGDGHTVTALMDGLMYSSVTRTELQEKLDAIIKEQGRNLPGEHVAKEAERGKRRFFEWGRR